MSALPMLFQITRVVRCFLVSEISAANSAFYSGQ